MGYFGSPRRYTHSSTFAMISGSKDLNTPKLAISHVRTGKLVDQGELAESGTHSRMWTLEVLSKVQRHRRSPRGRT